MRGAYPAAVIGREVRSVAEPYSERSDLNDALRKEGSCADACLQGGGGGGGEGGGVRGGEGWGGRDKGG